MTRDHELSAYVILDADTIVGRRYSAMNTWSRLCSVTNIVLARSRACMNIADPDVTILAQAWIIAGVRTKMYPPWGRYVFSDRVDARLRDRVR